MTTIDEIEDRLNAVAFSGRSYAGSSREEATAAYNAALADFEANAAVDIAYLIARVRELQAAIAVAAVSLADTASCIVERYAGTPDEAQEIRVEIGKPVDELLYAVQGTRSETIQDAQ